MPRHLIAQEGDIPAGSARTVEIEGADPVAVFRTDDGTLYATSDTCTHESWSLGDEGDLEGHEVLCPLHLARFDLATGKPLCLPATEALEIYTLEVDGQGAVYLVMPDLPVIPGMFGAERRNTLMDSTASLPTPDNPAEYPAHHSPSDHGSSILSRAFDLLNAFDSSSRVLTLNELAAITGLPKSTVHRLARRLTELGAIEQHRSGFRIGLRMLRYGNIAPALGMRDRALPYLISLQRVTRQPAHLAVLRGCDVVYLDKVTCSTVQVRPEIGTRLPATCTAVGKAMLAFEDPETVEAVLPQSPLPALTPASVRGRDAMLGQLAAARHDGIASEREEAQRGYACIAAPLLVNGYPVGGISVCHPSAVPLPRGAANALREAAHAISLAIARHVQLSPENFPREL